MLKACSLVSKSWVYPSYSHLFHSTKLMGYTAITSFVHLIQSSHPVFTQFIRHLRIEHLDESGHSNTVIQPQALASILPYLPSLRCLEFVGVGIASNPSKPPLQDEPRFALEHVEFSCCSFGDSSNFFRVLHMFAEITNLRVISPDTGSHVLSSPYADAPNPSPTKLQSFFFRFAPRTAGNFIHILNTATFLQELKLGCLPALDVALPDGPLAVAVSDFVYTLAPNLYAFSLDLRISSLGEGRTPFEITYH